MKQMALARLPKSFKLIWEVARTHCEPISLGQLLRTTTSDTKSLQQTASLLQKQVPARIARRIDDMLKLPHVVVSNPQFNRALKDSVDTFEAVHGFPAITTQKEEAAFASLISSHLDKHKFAARLCAEGYRDVRQLYPDIRLDDFLHDHFTTHIATRILMENYLEIRAPKEGFIGIVCQGMRPFNIVEDIVDDLTKLTHSLYGFSPMVEYRGNFACILDYIPHHVKYMMRELLKNAFRSTCERHQFKTDRNGNLQADVPPVAVEFQQGDHHVIIKISDHGGGMPKHLQPYAWQYGWSTVAPDSKDEELCISEHNMDNYENQNPSMTRAALRSKLTGYGFGLPLTRLHAQYFGGDVFMQALPGHGIDMYVVLTHLKMGNPCTDSDDLSSDLYARENPSKPKFSFANEPSKSFCA